MGQLHQIGQPMRRTRSEAGLRRYRGWIGEDGKRHVGDEPGPGRSKNLVRLDVSWQVPRLAAVGGESGDEQIGSSSTSPFGVVWKSAPNNDRDTRVHPF